MPGAELLLLYKDAVFQKEAPDHGRPNCRQATWALALDWVQLEAGKPQLPPHTAPQLPRTLTSR